MAVDDRSLGAGDLRVSVQLVQAVSEVGRVVPAAPPAGEDPALHVTNARGEAGALLVAERAHHLMVRILPTGSTKQLEGGRSGRRLRRLPGRSGDKVPKVSLVIGEPTDSKGNGRVEPGKLRRPRPEPHPVGDRPRLGLARDL